jgi:hypothetical protein
MLGWLVVGGAFVEVAHDRDQPSAFGAESIVDGTDLGTLAGAQRVGVPAGERLALEVVEQQPQVTAVGEAQLVDGAVAAEQWPPGPFGIGHIDMASDGDDLNPGVAQQPDVDAPGSLPSTSMMCP